MYLQNHSIRRGAPNQPIRVLPPCSTAYPAWKNRPLPIRSSAKGADHEVHDNFDVLLPCAEIARRSAPLLKCRLKTPSIRRYESGFALLPPPFSHHVNDL